MTSILTIALLSMTLSSPSAFAHIDPESCSINGGDTQVQLLRDGGPISGPVIQGQTIELKITIDKGGLSDHCAIDAADGEDIGLGTLVTLPDGTALPKLDWGCIGGTSNDGDNIGFADCSASPTEIIFDEIFYEVDCADVGINGFTDRLAWLQDTDAEYHDVAADEQPSPLTKDDAIQKECIQPPYEFDTLADNAGDTLQGPVSNPTDTVSITGVDGLAGDFDVDAVLSGPGGPHAATCDTVSSTGPGHVYSIDSICTATVDLQTEGTYCWDVTVTETGGNYDPSVVGPQFGQDTPNTECFDIENTYEFVTLADNAGETLQGPVSNPTDTVSITGNDGVAGDFDVDAVLTGPGGPHAATCDTVSSTGPGHVYSIDSTCTATVDLQAVGTYCWNVTVTETGGNYDPSVVGPQLGQDTPETECFDIQQEHYTFVTTSSLSGVQATGVSAMDPEDLVTITGVQGVEGIFETSAVLTGPDASLPLAAVCVTTPETTSTFDLEVTCTVLGTFSTAGVYCWDVTVNETGDNYFASDDGTQFGADDSTGNECFELVVGDFNGCTPGYWKANYDNRDAVNWFDGANPDSLITEVFSSANGDLDRKAAPDTVRDALSYKGGGGLDGAERNLLRAASAAWLNIGTGAFDYEFGTEVQLKAAVNAAIDSGSRSDMLNLASVLDAFNNAEDDEGIHCPLDNSNQQVD